MPQPLPSHQTVSLARGAHGSPEGGVCVMELASMLAGERFTDRPRSVCPIVAGYLRSLNDTVDDRRRQLLYPYASAAVGTTSDVAVRQRRLEWCRRELEAIDLRRSWLRRMLEPRPDVPSPSASSLALEHFAGHLLTALRHASRDWHVRALALADELIAITPVEPPSDRRDRSRGGAAAPHAGAGERPPTGDSSPRRR